MNTPDQNKSILTWTEQRDALLRDISTLQVTKDGLLKDNTNLAEGRTTAQMELFRLQGAIGVYADMEKERGTLVSKDISDLLERKARLEVAVSAYSGDLEDLEARKKSAQDSLAILLPLLERVTLQVNALNDTVAHVVTINRENTIEVNILISQLKDVLSTLVSQPKI